MAQMALGRRFRSVTIRRTKDSLGHMTRVEHYETRARRLALDGFRDVDAVIMAMAGPVAQKRGLRDRPGCYIGGGESDYRWAMQMARGCHPYEGAAAAKDSPMTQAILRAAVKEARLLLDDCWPAVEALAAALLERKTLKFAEAWVIWKEWRQEWISRIRAKVAG